MEPLEGRSTPALFFGGDPFVASLATLQPEIPKDWLAQPLVRMSITTCALLTDQQGKWETPAPVGSNPISLMEKGSGFEASREASSDALFQGEDWCLDPYGTTWSAFPENHNQDSLLMAGLAVIGIPLLNGGNGFKGEGEIVLPQRRSLKRRKKQRA